jgi:Fe-S-cluster formation regulator IscX/YfhJ
MRKNYLLDKAHDAAKEMSTERFAEQKLKAISGKGIKIDWRRPEGDIVHDLTEALIATGTNKYIADRAAKGIYRSMAPVLKSGKEHVFREEGLKLVPSTIPIRGGMETERRKKEDKFNRKRNRMVDKVITELRNFDYDARKTEEDYINAVKMTWVFRAAMKEMSMGESERMAVELARAARRKKLFERGVIGWKDVRRK